MKVSLSLLMITKNAQETIEKSLQSVVDWVDEVVIVDDDSKDKTIEKVKNLKCKVQSCNLKLKIFKNQEDDLGKQRSFGLSKCQNNWVLVLDSDEMISLQLKNEIKFKIQSSCLPAGMAKFKVEEDGFFVPIQAHYFGRELKYGGENYKKLVFFKKDEVIIKPGLVNEKFEITSGKVGCLKNKIYHYSYRSLGQMYKKFTDYAIRDARQKTQRGETTSLKKILLYPLHMFWERFIKDKGYKDGLFRIPLDIGFAYMELLTYLSMMFINSKVKSEKLKIQVKS